jgi:tryptophan synthase alpha chain
MLPRIRAHVKVPVGVGFGIRDAPPQGRGPGVGRGGDRLALVQILHAQTRDNAAAKRPGAFMAEIRAALDELELAKE